MVTVDIIDPQTCPTCGKMYGRTRLMCGDREIWAACDCWPKDKVAFLDTRKIQMVEVKTEEQTAALKYARERYVGDHWADEDCRKQAEADFLAGIEWRDANPKRPVDPHGRGKWTENE